MKTIMMIIAMGIMGCSGNSDGMGAPDASDEPDMNCYVIEPGSTGPPYCPYAKCTKVYPECVHGLCAEYICGDR